MEESIFERYRDREEHTAILAQDAMDVEVALDEEEENHDPSQICWRNLCDDDDRLKVITGLNCEKFLEIYELVEDALPVKTGRGRRSKVSKHDRLLMTLCYLKHYETLDKMKETFQISKSHLHNILESTIEIISPLLYAHFVEEAEAAVPEEDDDFPDARYVMDVTFQPIWTPLGTYEERKRFYSGKHKQYGLKSQCIHGRSGKLVHCMSGIPGSVHDLTIARNSIDQVPHIEDSSSIDE